MRHDPLTERYFVTLEDVRQGPVQTEASYR